MRFVLPLVALLAVLSGCASLNGATAGDDAMTMSATDSMTGMQGGMSGMSEMPAGMAHVKIGDGAFDPSMVNATVDGGIHFTNEGTRRHTVTILDGTGAIVLDTTLEPGQAVHFKADSPGNYHAFCRLHEGMSTELHVS